MEKWLSRKVRIDNRNPQLAIVTIENGRVEDVHPFRGEEHSTVYTVCEILVDSTKRTAIFVSE